VEQFKGKKMRKEGEEGGIYENFNEEFLVALLKWLTEPGFPIRWAASEGMATFALNHLDACALAYAELGDVKKACMMIREEQNKVLAGEVI
jgi:hypothetical protein